MIVLFCLSESVGFMDSEVSNESVLCLKDSLILKRGCSGLSFSGCFLSFPSLLLPPQQMKIWSGAPNSVSRQLSGNSFKQAVPKYNDLNSFGCWG